MSSRRTADQSWAVAGLRSINSAANTYATTYGHGYPASLAVLGPPTSANPSTPTPPTENAAALIPENLASGLRSQYRFTYVGVKPNGAEGFTAYTVRADPFTDESVGYDHYYSDQSGVIRFEPGREANERSKPIQSR